VTYSEKSDEKRSAEKAVTLVKAYYEKNGSKPSDLFSAGLLAKLCV
jgi:hypothetical protein